MNHSELALKSQDKPVAVSANPCFSSGPCAEPPTWSLDALKDSSLSRSHRAAIGKEKLKAAIGSTREVLGILANDKIGVVPASGTGAAETTMRSLLGERPVQMLALEIRRCLGYRPHQTAEDRRTRSYRRLWRDC